jgi:cobalt-precorrin-5B (C1)-methyltransferase
MRQSSPRAGYTLPVFACASAVAALQYLKGERWVSPKSPTVQVDLLDPAEVVDIAVEQIAPLPDGAVLAITRSDPGDNLDLTRDTPVWALVQPGSPEQIENVAIASGEGIGRRFHPSIHSADTQDDAGAIYTYARRLLLTNLERLLPPGQTIRVTLILPEGRQLALRTSNAAFGVVDGLSLLGTSGIAQPLSTPEQLETFRTILSQKAKTYQALTFCIGENGLDLARHSGIAPEQCIKTANWLGPLLAEAALQGIRSILLFGYHGKLIKLAGGIFHTHHHVADGRSEILAAYCAEVGLPTPQIQAVLAAPTTEAGLTLLRQWDQSQGSNWVERLYSTLANRIDQRAQTYIYQHTQLNLKVGCVLFDRQRQVFVKSTQGAALLPQFC